MEVILVLALFLKAYRDGRDAKRKMIIAEQKYEQLRLRYIEEDKVFYKVARFPIFGRQEAPAEPLPWPLTKP